jgi:hypothetical protein
VGSVSTREGVVVKRRGREPSVTCEHEVEGVDCSSWFLRWLYIQVPFYLSSAINFGEAFPKIDEKTVTAVRAFFCSGNCESLVALVLRSAPSAAQQESNAGPDEHRVAASPLGLVGEFAALRACPAFLPARTLLSPTFAALPLRRVGRVTARWHGSGPGPSPSPPSLASASAGMLAASTQRRPKMRALPRCCCARASLPQHFSCSASPSRAMRIDLAGSEVPLW